MAVKNSKVVECFSYAEMILSKLTSQILYYVSGWLLTMITSSYRVGNVEYLCKGIAWSISPWKSVRTNFVGLGLVTAYLASVQIS